MISVVCLLFTVGAHSIDPNVKMFGDYLYESNLNQGLTVVNGVYSLTTNSSSSLLPSQSTTGASITGYLFPDWLNSGLSWLTNTFSWLFNFIGAPFGMLLAVHVPLSIASIIGGFYATIFIIIFVLFVLGREN